MFIRDENTVAGKLKVNIIHAKDLRIADSKSSDPYTVIRFPGGQEAETKVISSCLFPYWNESFIQDVLIPEDQAKVIKFSVKDKDLLAKDDILGYVDVDFTKCVTEAGTWAINNIFDLSGPPDVRGQ